MARSTTDVGIDDSSLPLVSVILPTYNARAFVTRAIESVFAQTYQRFELLIVDDASADDTVDVVRALTDHDDRVSVTELAANVGPAGARNVALDSATGEWIALIDADDAWRPERLARLLALASPDVDWVLDGLVGYDAHLGRETGPLFGELPPNGPTFTDFVAPPTPERPYEFAELKPFIRRRFLTDHELRYDESLRTSEDLVLAMRMLLEGARGRSRSDSLYVYTKRVGEVSRKKWDGSHTIPRPAEIVAALEAICHDYAGRVDEMTLVLQRIEFFKERGLLAEFVDARRNRDPIKMGKLLVKEPAVRKAIVRKSWRTLRDFTK